MIARAFSVLAAADRGSWGALGGFVLMLAALILAMAVAP